MEYLQVGKLFNEKKTRYSEGITFNMNDLGCDLIIRFNVPTEDEIKNIKFGALKCGYYVEKQVILMLFKFENEKWLDAPYSIKLSKNLTEIPNIEDGKGLPLHVYLIDAYTGILKVMRLIILPTNFSRNLLEVIKKQNDMPFNDFEKLFNRIYRKYSTRELVKYADKICVLPTSI
jgi:hypothetical protein